LSVKYEVVIKTGDDEQAGTTREVWFKVDGTNHATPWIHFDDLEGAPEKLFRRGKIASCQFETEANLGELQSIWLKLHPQDGSNPEWLVDTVEVMHGDTSDMWRLSTWVSPGTPVCAGPEKKC